MQILSIDTDAGTVRVYHTRPSKAGTADFECGGTVALTDVVTQDNELVVTCPGDCGTVSTYPANGDATAQALHAAVAALP